MEVPGRKLQADASAADTTYCQPCALGGDNLPAEAYCTVCKEFLCSTCASVHRKQKVSRSHLLLDKSNMPTSIRDQVDEDECTEPCETHPKEFIKYFCPTHQTLNCGHCLVQNHRSCHVDVISEISKALKDGKEFDDFKTAMTKLFQDIDSCTSDVEKNVEIVARLGEHEVDQLRRYREEVNKYFEEREQALLELIETIKNKDEALLGSLKPKCEDIRSKLEQINATMEAQENNTIQLFIETKRAKKILEGLNDALGDINMENAIHNYKFRKDPDTERFLASGTGLGTLEEIVTDDTAAPETQLAPPLNMDGPNDTKATEKPTVRLTSAADDLTKLSFTPAVDISVKSPTDNSNCFLTSMLLLPGDRLLLTDWQNMKVKLVDLNTTSMVSQVSMSDQPWAMCLLHGDRVAVTMATSGIQFLETRGQLTLGDRINVESYCQGIAYHEDQLIVSYHFGELKVLNMSGSVIRKIEKENGSQRVFGRPLYLTVVCEDSYPFIYVSDYTKNTITKLDMNLNIMQTFKDPALIIPKGITAVGNQLLICGNMSNNIMTLDLDGGQMTQLLEKKEGIQYPQYVCYCPQQRKLFVSRYNADRPALNKSVHVYTTSK